MTVQNLSPLPLAARLLRLPDVQRITGLSRSTIYALIKEGRFPLQRRIAANVVAWSAAEVHSWVDNLLSQGSHAEGHDLPQAA